MQESTAHEDSYQLCNLQIQLLWKSVKKKAIMEKHEKSSLQFFTRDLVRWNQNKTF